MRAGLIVTVALATFFTLWLFRVYDDNRLVSWYWAFADTGAFGGFRCWCLRWRWR